MLKKGDRVKFFMDKQKTIKCYGVVVKGGKNVSVYRDGTYRNGSYDLVIGPSVSFQPSNEPLPTDKTSVMDKWGITGYRSIESHDGYAISATVTLNGKKVLKVFNSGDGGPNQYDGDPEVIVKLEKDAEKWHKQFTKKEYSEAEDLWVEWCHHYKPLGILAKTYLND